MAGNTGRRSPNGRQRQATPPPPQPHRAGARAPDAAEPSKERFTPAQEVLSRIRWDANLGGMEGWVVGYEDRFLGVVEQALAEFVGESRELTDEVFVPLHRVRYFKHRDAVVWDRAGRVDSLDTIAVE